MMSYQDRQAHICPNVLETPLIYRIFSKTIPEYFFDEYEVNPSRFEYGSAVESILNVVESAEVQSRVGSAVESMEVQSRVYKCSREFGSAVESINVQSRAVECSRVQSRVWKFSREKKCSRKFHKFSIWSKKN